MRWHLSTWRGTLAGAKNTRERNAAARGWLIQQPQQDCDAKVVATDTRSGKVVELTLPLRVRTVTPSSRVTASD